MPRRPTRTRLYWICQLAGWAAFGGIWVGLAALTGGIGERSGVSTLEIVTAVVVSYVLCVGASHGIHLAATRRGWRRLPLWALAVRLLGASFAAAAAMQAVGTVFFRLAEPVLNPHAVGPKPWPEPVEALGSVLMGTALFAAWSTVYAFGLVAFRLTDAERERLGLRAALAESRMRALEYQLNPHFLFNALNTVRALVRDEPEEARRAVTLLSGLLRRTLAAGRETTHPLRDELALVGTYLDLEALRFDGRLRVRLDVADDVLDVPVPALLVQTLVENALKHGVARRRDGGEVVVRAARDGDRLALRVENPTASGPASDGTGTGLANARERLALLFGDAARLDLAVDAERAVASVTLPIVSDA
ncbi:sensor histidine kinase [Rubrivirga sp. IMCC43871]|uniref:sensor histidine kinase n=1 Tax=Rubrivirga sp. IMCC43871 TaxID=3391575 RepID=UPI00398FDDE7